MIKKSNKEVEEIYKKYYDYLMSVFSKKTYNYDLSKDLTQDCFLHIIKQLEKNKDIVLTKSWIYKVASNFYIDYIRVNKKYKNNISLSNISSFNNPSNTYKNDYINVDTFIYQTNNESIKTELYSNLSDIILNLLKNYEQKEIYTQYYIKGNTVSTTATTLNLERNFVYKTINEIKTIIKLNLKEEYHDNIL
jgi:RNA polymerase sigma factor (sigma-70 family)